MRSSSIPTLPLLLSLSAFLGLSAAALASGGHGGLPAPTVDLASEEVVVPFVLPDGFPVPVVEVRLNGTGPWRLAVDTAMGGTVLLRRDVASSLDLPVAGRAMVGDSSGAPPRPADLIRIEEMVVGGLTVRDILGIGFAADEAHLSGVPDDLDGILGNQIYAELLATLDYPAERLVFRKGRLEAGLPGTVEVEEKGRVLVVDLEIAGTIVPVTVDSGHRDGITLPRSFADTLPLAEELREAGSLSTVSTTYRREAARLDGEAVLGGVRIPDPELMFADEDSPRLLGFGVLRRFAITIDQQSRRLRLTPSSPAPLEGVELSR